MLRAAAAPLVSYRLRFYGSTPLKLDSVIATVAQPGSARIFLLPRTKRL